MLLLYSVDSLLNKNDEEQTSAGIVACACFFNLGFWNVGVRSATCPPTSCAFPLYGPALNVDSNDHVIGLVGSAFNEGVLLDINH